MVSHLIRCAIIAFKITFLQCCDVIDGNTGQDRGHTTGKAEDTTPFKVEDTRETRDRASTSAQHR
jgi:hypothetical protein